MPKYDLKHVHTDRRGRVVGTPASYFRTSGFKTQSEHQHADPTAGIPEYSTADVTDLSTVPLFP
jgi:hypothetical protein